MKTNKYTVVSCPCGSLFVVPVLRSGSLFTRRCQRPLALALALALALRRKAKAKSQKPKTKNQKPKTVKLRLCMAIMQIAKIMAVLQYENSKMYRLLLLSGFNCGTQKTYFCEVVFCCCLDRIRIEFAKEGAVLDCNTIPRHHETHFTKKENACLR